VEARGALRASPAAGQDKELAVETLRLIGEAPADRYPLQKKKHSFEFLRGIAHLRPRANTFGAVARIRNALSMAVHRYFQERGFVYVHTPIITASDAEGAGAQFQITTLDLDALARGASPPAGGIDYSRDFFGTKTALTVSGQLEAEALACALTRVYTFGPTFRAEHSNTVRHLSEFWMIEPEIAFADLDTLMDMAEEFLKTLLAGLLADCAGDLAFFDARVEPGLLKRLERIACGGAFTRITYTEAIARLERAAENGAAFDFAPFWGCDLQSEHERCLTAAVGGPVIVTDYPKEIKAFYMRQNDDGRTVRAMDILVPRLGEIIGGSQREERLPQLAARLQALGLDPASYEWYLDLRRFGSVPHAGFGLGFERLIQYVTGMQNIRDVIPFPRSPGQAAF
jgi:asparaginyl-tRNA synthetase